MGIEGGLRDNEVQNQEIQRTNIEQETQNQEAHFRSGEELEANPTIDNEGERKQIEGRDDSAKHNDEVHLSELDKDVLIEDDPVEYRPQNEVGESHDRVLLEADDSIESDKSVVVDDFTNDEKIVDSLEKDEGISDDIIKTDSDEVHKGLTEKEEVAVKNITTPHFDRAREITQIAKRETEAGIAKDDMGANFTDHNEKHVEQVKEKTIEAMDACVSAINEGKLERPDAEGDVHFNDKVDYKVVEAAALAHDTGMSDDGYSIKLENKEPVKSDNGGYIIEKQNPENFNQVRENHSANSALNILKNRDQYEEAGFTTSQVDEIAVLAYTHSKSSSGVGNLNDSGSWDECFNRMDAFVEKYNEDNPDKPITFDRTQFEGEKNKERLGAVATESLSLRVGDVSRDSGPEAVSQSGEVVYVERETINTEARDWKEEIQNAIVTRGDGTVDNEKSKQVHIGEQNIIDNHTEFRNDKLVHTITINDGNSAPYCTIEAISDHLGELSTAKNAEFVVELHFEQECDVTTKYKYEKMRNDLNDDICDNIELQFPWDKEE